MKPIRLSSRDIIDLKKERSEHRPLSAEQTLVNPEAFKETMRQVREDYEVKSAASVRKLRDVVLK